MRQIPGADESPNVREAYIAGASVSDTPDSAAAWSFVVRWPGQRMKAMEASGRVPVHNDQLRVPAGADEEEFRKRLPIYPGTLLAAEWFACQLAISFVRTLHPKSNERDERIVGHDAGMRYFQPPRLEDTGPLPLVLYTTRNEIAEFLEGRAPIGRRKWLRGVQMGVASVADGTLDDPPGSLRQYFFPADRPWPGRRTFGVYGVPVYVRVVSAQMNRRAERLARIALQSTERPLYARW